MLLRVMDSNFDEVLHMGNIMEKTVPFRKQGVLSSRRLNTKLKNFKFVLFQTSDGFFRARGFRLKVISFLLASVLLLFIIRNISGFVIMNEVKFMGKEHDEVKMLMGQVFSGQESKQLITIASEEEVGAHSLSNPGEEFHYRLGNTFAIYISYLRICLQNGDHNPILPFSWNDWYDLTSTSKSDDFFQETFDFSVVDSKESQEIKARRGLSYMKSLNYKVERLIFMDSDANKNFVTKVENDFSGRSSVQDPGFDIVSLLYSKRISSTHFDYQSDLRLISQIQLSNGGALDYLKFETRSNKDYDSFDGDDMFINLHESDFEYNLTERIEEFDNFELAEHSNPLLTSYYEKLLSVKNRPASNLEKFFHEVELENDPSLAGSHYDWRFFKKVLQGKNKYFALHHLIRTWQEFANKEKIIYWLSHGNLLSWRWSGTAFLWDHDCDIQLPIKHLEYLAVNFNGSLIIEDPRYGLNRYLVEVNPYFSDRLNINGKNSIDGRIIDLATGLYIDLTGISANRQLEGEITTNLLRDKHVHKYLYQSLTPLRSTLYEGKRSWVPHDVDYILAQEYPTGLVDTRYQDYHYLPNFNAWFRSPDLCLERSLSDDHVFHIASDSSHTYCDDLNFLQLSHLMKFWNLKRIEDEFLCFNKLNCRLPLDPQALEFVASSSYDYSVSNHELWNLSDFTVDGLRNVVNLLNLAPIPGTDMSSVL